MFQNNNLTEAVHYTDFFYRKPNSVAINTVTCFHISLAQRISSTEPQNMFLILAVCGEKETKEKKKSIWLGRKPASTGILCDN